jgi:hypothetical protein
MTDQSYESACVLTLNVGSYSTRAILIDVVDGQYRFIGAGDDTTTDGAPYYDVRVGAVSAIRQLEQMVDRRLVDAQGNMMMPANTDGSGFDFLVIIYSAIPELRVVVTGLINEISIESAQHLVAGMYGRVVETISLHDKRNINQQVDEILRQEPNLIVLAGGANGGATRSIGKLTQLAHLICQFSSGEKTPQVLFVGNNQLSKSVSNTLDKYCIVNVADNIRSSTEVESLDPARLVLEEIIGNHARQHINGLDELLNSASIAPVQSATGMGWLVRMIQAINGNTTQILGVDVGASYSSMAVVRKQRLMDITLAMGMGRTIDKLLTENKLEEISQWLPPTVTKSVLRDSMAQKTIYPQLQALSSEQIAIEQACLRILLRTLLQNLQYRWHMQNTTFEPILLTGKSLAARYSPGISLMLALDGLQPTGITTILQDPHCLLPVLGAVGRLNPLIPVQVFDSGALNHLATVICPVSRAPIGTPILDVKITSESGKEEEMQVKQGALVVLPIHFSQNVVVHLQGLHNTWMNPFSRTTNANLKLTGGLCGILIDARGRPINLPKDPANRWERIEKWQNIFA